MATSTTSGAVPESKRSFGQVVRSYIFWDYRRGSLHYDVMVTLILLFIFVAPHIWDFGARPTSMSVVAHPIQIAGYDTYGMMVTIMGADLNLPPGASDHEVKDALKKAIQPVAGDAVFVERWKTITDSQGNLEWQVWAHR